MGRGAGGAVRLALDVSARGEGGSGDFWHAGEKTRRRGEVRPARRVPPPEGGVGAKAFDPTAVVAAEAIGSGVVPKAADPSAVELAVEGVDSPGDFVAGEEAAFREAERGADLEPAGEPWLRRRGRSGMPPAGWSTPSAC